MPHQNDCSSLLALLEIMQALRAPDGCPWDAGQTPESLTPYILEEACELIDAIEHGSPELILDELGDLLLQVVFQAQIFKERHQFDFHDVAAGISEKLVRRHPHVFDSSRPRRHDTELDAQWEAVKSSETTQRKTCLADHLPSKLPALQRAQKLVSKAYRTDHQATLPVIEPQVLQQIGQADDDPSRQLDEEILGQALFHLVHLAHQADLDAEGALRRLTSRIIGKQEP